MVDTIKFSEFSEAGDLTNGDITVGLKSGANVRINNPWSFIASGTTGERPDPVSADLYYRLRFNTTLVKYEYYDPDLTSWVQIESSGDIDSIYTTLASHDVGEGAELIGLEDQTGSSATVTSKTVQDMSESSFIAQTNDGTLANAQFLADLTTGILKSTTTTGVLSISAPLTSIDGLTTASNKMIYTTGSNTYATTDLTSFARTLLDDSSAATAAATLEVLPLSGGTMSGQIAMASNKIVALADPTGNQDAATKKYVDDATGGGITPAALTRTNDTNVTLTLGGTPSTALLEATSLTLGWTGTLSVARGGTGQSSYTDGQLLIGNSTGNTLDKGTLTGTPFQVNVTNAGGSITLSTPQDIATTSSPTFVDITADGGVNVGFTGTPTAKTVKVGDTNFYMQNSSGTPMINFDSADFMTYNRTTDLLAVVLGTSTKWSVSGTQLNSYVNTYIGGSGTPNSYLQFPSDLVRRKITLYEVADNDHQFLGFGTQTGGLVYQVNSLTDSHKFYTGTSASTSDLLLEISGKKSLIIGDGAVATNAIDGFLYISSCAGTPTGTPSAFSGRTPMVYDSTNDQLYLYDGSWKSRTFGGVLPVNEGGTGQSSYTDGQLLIGNSSGNTLTKATLTGTVDQVLVSNGNGSITLSLPQSIDTSSSPTFVGVTATSGMRVGFSGTPSDDSIQVGDAGLYLAFNSGNPILNWDSNDFITYNRSTNVLDTYINSNVMLRTTASYILSNTDVGVGITPPNNFNALWIANDSGDSNNTFRIDGFGNVLGIVASSEPGAATGSQIALSTQTAGTGSSVERMRISDSGNVGIGVAAPNSLLHFPSNISPRVVTLYEVANNDHQFLGFGVNSGIRYQVNGTSDSHIFQTGLTSSSSQELGRITGTKSWIIGDGAIATSASDGFLYLPTCPGVPTGTPSTATGRNPLVYDSTNENLYAQNGTSWLPIFTGEVRGSFTPTMSDTSGNNFTTSVAVASYYRVGQMVFYSIQVVWTGKGSAVGADQLRINMPSDFKVSGSSVNTAVTLGYTSGLTIVNDYITGSQNKGDDFVLLFDIKSGVAPDSITVNSAATSGEIQITGCIFVS